MKVWHFSEMAFHPAWPELRDSCMRFLGNSSTRFCLRRLTGRWERRPLSQLTRK